MRNITLSQAVNEALAEEMRRDETVFLIGEDVAEAGTPFKVLSGLVEEFGTSRVIDTPIAEPGFMGLAVGAAMTGARPDRRSDVRRFPLSCHGSALQPGRQDALHVRRQAERAVGSAHQPWRNPAFGRAALAILASLGGPYPRLKVAMPSSAYEAKGLMKTAIRDNNPVVIFEDKLMYQDKAPVPEEEYLIPFGEAKVLREGRDVTLIGTSSMRQVCEKGRRGC